MKTKMNNQQIRCIKFCKLTFKQQTFSFRQWLNGCFPLFHSCHYFIAIIDKTLKDKPDECVIGLIWTWTYNNRVLRIRLLWAWALNDAFSNYGTTWMEPNLIKVVLINQYSYIIMFITLKHIEKYKILIFFIHQLVLLCLKKR